MAQLMSRRGFLATTVGAVSLSGLGTLAPAANGATKTDGATVTPTEALRFLREGNSRWVAGNPQRIDHVTHGRLLVKGQWPFAAILSCADSRVNHENVFDVAEGNHFKVRNAGNVAGDISIGSLEYAVAVLGVPLVMVLGHSGCGAVKATQSAVDTGRMPGGDIDAIIDQIRPAIERLPANHTLEQATKAYARHSAQALLDASDVVPAAVKKGRLDIVEGVHNPGTKKVQFLP
jgi:carbonic anhydrase